MAFLDSIELQKLGFPNVGENVKISEFVRFHNLHPNSTFGDSTRIDDYCLITGKVNFGRNVHIAPFVILDGGQEGISVGDFSSISYKSTLITRSDDFMGLSLSNPTIPQKYRRTENKSIEIGRHVRIAMHCIVLPGSILQDGSVLALQSVFRGVSEAFALYQGNPAIKVMSTRSKVMQYEKDFLRELSRE